MPNKQDAINTGRNLILAQARSCWVPLMAKNAGGMSQYYGSPWLSEKEEWPSILRKPAQFVLQIDLATLPTSMQLLVGNKGLLQFFYQPDDSIAVDWEKGNSQLSLVRIVDPATTVGGPRAQPKINGYPKKPTNYITGWNERPDYPHIEEYENQGLADELEKLAASAGLYEEEFAGNKYIALQGDKLGGWPFWAQAAEYPLDSFGEPMELLYQVDAGFFYDGPHVKAYAKNLFAGDGTGHIFASRRKLGELRFEWATG